MTYSYTCRVRSSSLGSVWLDGVGPYRAISGGSPPCRRNKKTASCLCPFSASPSSDKSYFLSLPLALCWYALDHKGVLARAEWVREDLETQGHLEKLLGSEETLTTLRRRPRCRGYSLRVTGHSLGGSTGVLLSYMLRRNHPSVKCISISPMGGLLNAPYAQNCGEFVLSAALGEDVVPRLSVTAMERMRDEVLELIARSKVT